MDFTKTIGLASFALFVLEKPYLAGHGDGVNVFFGKVVKVKAFEKAKLLQFLQCFIAYEFDFLWSFFPTIGFCISHRRVLVRPFFR